VKKPYPKTNAFILTSSLSVGREAPFIDYCSTRRKPGRGTHGCEAVAPIKKQDRITGVQIRAATGVAWRIFSREGFAQMLLRRMHRASPDETKSCREIDWSDFLAVH
jgi:hypothetical protein